MRVVRGGARAAGLVIGVLADGVFGDPRRGHPVAAFGTVATALERRLYRDSVPAGAAYAAVLTGGTVALGVLAERAAPRPVPPCPRPSRSRVVASPHLVSSRRPAFPLPACRSRARSAVIDSSAARADRSVRARCRTGDHERAGGVVGPRGGRWAVRCAVTALATWAVLGGTSLVREGEALGRSLQARDLDAARERIPHLCARDPSLLDADGMARAGVESLAENTSDAVVAPLFWGAVAGVPGLLGYRAVNTLDAMVGYRSPRYTRFGRVAARLDDVANLVPARLTAALSVVLAPAVGGRPADAIRAWRRDAASHPSPNAGPVEATAAGALGLRLGGLTEYAYGAEDRPTLGDGRAPGPADLARAARLSRLLAVAAALVAAGLAVVAGPVRCPLAPR